MDRHLNEIDFDDVTKKRDEKELLEYINVPSSYGKSIKIKDILFEKADKDILKKLLTKGIVVFEHCKFISLDLSKECFVSMNFLKCYFENANFSDTTFCKETHFDGSLFKGKTNFDNAHFKNDIYFESIHTLGGTFYCRGHEKDWDKYKNDGGHLYFNNSLFEGEVNFNGRYFNHVLDFRHSTFTTYFWFADCHFGTDTMFNNVKYTSLQDLDNDKLDVCLLENCFTSLRFSFEKSGFKLAADDIFNYEKHLHARANEQEDEPVDLGCDTDGYYDIKKIMKMTGWKKSTIQVYAVKFSDYFISKRKGRNILYEKSKIDEFIAIENKKSLTSK